MSHYIDTMVVAHGRKPWHFAETGPTGQTTVVEGGLTLDNFRAPAKLLWDAEKCPVYFSDGTLVQGLFGLRRNDTGAYLGPAGADYEVETLENTILLAKALIDMTGAKVETAMSLKGGQIVTLLLQLEPFNVLGSRFFPYASFANYHSGGSRKVYLTDVDEVCWNTHSRSIGSARAEKRIWAKRHFKNSLEVNEQNLADAREILQLSQQHGENLQALAETLAAKRMEKKDWLALANHLFPDVPLDTTSDTTKKASLRSRGVVDEQRSLLFQAVSLPYLSNDKHNAWGGLRAVTDMDKALVSGSAKTKPEVILRRQEDKLLETLEGSDLEGKALEFLLAYA